MTQVILYLNKQADRRIKRGHLWIYSNEVDTARSPLKTMPMGGVVEVRSATNQSLGLALMNPNALICGRIFSRRADTVLDAAFFETRLRGALQLRERFYAKPYYRLIYGDADLLPGVVIDRFGDVFVVQISSAGMDLLLQQLIDALDTVFSPKGIVLRNNHAARELEELDDQLQVMGDVPERLHIEENSTRFEFSSTSGQKTGWFYDHRQNREYLQRIVKDRSVLDVFSYVGAWGIQCLQAGASSLTCIDASQTAMDFCQSNAALNGVVEKYQGHKGKAIDVLKQLLDDKQKFDVVVVDPPAFIKRKKDQKAGEAAYRHINELAIRLLNNDGILVSASCSMPLTNEALTDIVRGAARHNDRTAQLVYTGVQAPDHPIHPAIPETGYIKAQFYRVMTALD